MENIGPLARELRQQEHDAILHSVNNYIADKVHPDGTIGPLRPEQTTTFYKFRDFLAETTPGEAKNSPQSLASLACSYGKTPLLACIADATGAGQERVDGKKRQVIIATSRDILLGQMASDSSGLRVFAPRVTTSTYNQDVKDPTGDVIVTSYNSLPAAYLRKDIQGGQMSGILLDEVHNMGKLRAKVVRQESQGAVVFGVSATTGDAERYIPRVIDRVTMADGIMKYGFLCGMRFYGIQTNEVFEATADSPSKDYLPSDMRMLAHSDARNKIIVDTARFCIENLGPGFISCIPGNNQQHAFAIAKMLARSGDITDLSGVTRPINVEGLGTSRRDSREVGEQFRFGTGDVLTQIRYLEEGYDASRIRWAILGRQTRSMRVIIQFLGRGGRPDGDDKIFTAFELIDDEVHNPEAQKHLWDAFDLPLRQGTLIRKEGISYQDYAFRNSPTLTRNKLPTFLQQPKEEERTSHRELYFEAFKGPLSPEAEALTEGLFDMCGETALQHSWAQRILFYRGLRARIIINSQGQAEPVFSSEARAILQREVAGPDDVTLTMASEQMGIGKAPIIKWIKEDGLKLKLLHTHRPGASQKLPHFSADQFAAFVQHHGIRGGVPEERISNQELKELVNSSQSSLHSFFSVRGFSVMRQQVKGKSGHPQPTFLRSQVEPWAEAFLAAQPAPQNGFAQLQGYTIRNYEHRRPTVEELFAVASLIRMPLYYFTTKANRRVEYIAEEHHEAFTEALATYIAHPDTFTQTEAPLYLVHNPAEPQPACQALTVEQPQEEPKEDPEEEFEEMFEPEIDTSELDYIQEFESTEPASAALEPTTPAAARPVAAKTARPQPKPQSRRIEAPITFTYTIPVSPKVDISRAVMNCDQRQRPTSNSLVRLEPLAPTRRINAVNLSRYAGVQTHSMPTLLAILSCLEGVDLGSTAPVGIMQNGDVGASPTTFEELSQVLREHGNNNEPVPYTWSFSDDIARYLSIDPGNLRKTLLEGNFNNNHLRGMYIDRFRSSLLFCSPGLTTRVLHYHLRTLMG